MRVLCTWPSCTDTLIYPLFCIFIRLLRPQPRHDRVLAVALRAALEGVRAVRLAVPDLGLLYAQRREYYRGKHLTSSASFFLFIFLSSRPWTIKPPSILPPLLPPLFLLFSLSLEKKGPNLV